MLDTACLFIYGDSITESERRGAAGSFIKYELVLVTQYFVL